MRPAEMIFPSYWLLKTEPGTYCFSQLLKDRKTNWNGIRNFQARNYLRQMIQGDLAIIYHSGEDRAAMGVAKITLPAYPDPDPEKPGDWVQVDLTPVETFQRPVSLQEIKSNENLKTLPLIRQSRLSVMPITASHYETLLKLGKKKA